MLKTISYLPYWISENKDSWDWFLVQLRYEIIYMEGDVVITPDRQKRLMDAIYLVFPNAHHIYYLHHLAQNFTRR